MNDLASQKNKFLKSTQKINSMKKVTLILLGFVFSATAQINPDIAKGTISIEMLFPEGKTKALILSYDDGTIYDRKLVALMNQYHLIGTFHLNSNKLGTDIHFNYLSKEEVKDLFAGHEVSVHSANHPNLPDVSKNEVINEVVSDRKELERLVGYPVRGMAYPFGNTNDLVVSTIAGLGIEYARTVGDSYHFDIPNDFLRWHPTIHQFAKAYWEANQPEKDKQELTVFIHDFLQTKELAVFDIWGHSWEMGSDQNKWNETEKFFKLLANNPSIYYAKQIDLVDYINAFRSLKYAIDKKTVTNNSSLNICLKVNDKVYTVLAGSTMKLN
jgi:peptidoglycan/xylan/chitin deacetylase (PgdA/CDA1 family)